MSPTLTAVNVACASQLYRVQRLLSRQVTNSACYDSGWRERQRAIWAKAAVVEPTAPDAAPVVAEPLRYKRGAEASKARLTDDAVRDIRANADGYGANKRLAEKYGVSRAAISDIKNGRTWRHVV